jgi:hypothetical protein
MINIFESFFFPLGIFVFKKNEIGVQLFFIDRANNESTIFDEKRKRMSLLYLTIFFASL